MIASMSSPDTRPSLLLRLRDSTDHDSWQEFCDIYRPMIVRLALTKGLQNAAVDWGANGTPVAVEPHSISVGCLPKTYWNWLSHRTMVRIR